MTDPGHIDWYPTDEERAAKRRALIAEAVAAERERITREVEAVHALDSMPHRHDPLDSSCIACLRDGLLRALVIVNPEAERA